MDMRRKDKQLSSTEMIAAGMTDSICMLRVGWIKLGCRLAMRGGGGEDKNDSRFQA